MRLKKVSTVAFFPREREQFFNIRKKNRVMRKDDNGHWGHRFGMNPTVASICYFQGEVSLSTTQREATGSASYQFGDENSQQSTTLCQGQRRAQFGRSRRRAYSGHCHINQ